MSEWTSAKTGPDLKEEQVDPLDLDADRIKELIQYKDRLIATLVKLTNYTTNSVEYVIYSFVGSFILFIGLLAAKFGGDDDDK